MLLSDKQLLARWQSYSDLQPQLEELYTELGVHQEKWEEIEEMLLAHESRIKKISVMSKQHGDTAAVFQNQYHCVGEKVSGKGFEIGCVREDLRERIIELGFVFAGLIPPGDDA